MAARKKAKKPTRASAKTPRKKAVKKSATRRAKVNPLAKGMHTVTPYLCFQDAAFAMAFYEAAFGAKEIYRLMDAGNKIGHAEMRIGDSVVMCSDEFENMSVSAKTLNGSPVKLSIMVKNPDAFMQKALAAGATMVRPMADQFYGWRSGVVMDPFGYSWFIGAQIEVVSPREMQKRMDKFIAAHKTEGAA